MSTPTASTDDLLAERIRTACAAEVAALQVDDRPFDPGRAAHLDGVDLDGNGATGRRGGGGPMPGPSASSRPHRALAVAAAILIVLGLAVAISQRPRGGRASIDTVDGTTTSSPISTTVPEALRSGAVMVAPDPSLLGLPLTSVRWEPDASLRGGGVAGGRQQLFASEADPTKRVLVEVDSHAGLPSSASPVRIWGGIGRLDRTPGPRRDEVHVTWGTDRLSATAVGFGDQEVVAALEGLRWRSDDHREGVEPSPGGSLVLLAEADPEPGPVALLELSYGDRTIEGSNVGETKQVTVTVVARGSTGPTPAYLAAWLSGEVDPERGVGARRLYVPAGGYLTIEEPGQPSITVTASGAPMDEAELDAVVDSMAPIDLAGIAALSDQVEQDITQAKVRASERIGDATIEVRDVAGGRAVCLVVRGERGCSTLGAEERATNSVVLDGTWFLSVVSPEEPIFTSAPGSPSRSVLDAEVRALGPPLDGFRAGVVTVPDGVDQVTVWTGAGGSDVRRPGR